MQQESTKKNKKLIWLIAGLVALLVIVGVVLAIFLQPGEAPVTEPTGPVGGRAELYWNVDRHKYLGDDNTAGLSKREAGEDGLYHIRFAIDGGQVEYTIADKRLVNVIDSYDVVGLSFDADGNVVDAIDPTTIATEAAKGFFVMRAQGNRLDMNSSFLMNGMSRSLMLGDLAKVYDVTPEAQTVGMESQLEVMDKVLIYANDMEEITHIYIVERQPEAEVYWRADRMYDSATASTSRVPDENGVYTIPFAYKGKQVELKCKDKALVSEIDKVMIYACPFGLIFDEEGYIIDTIDPGIALRGMLLGTSFNITAMDGDNITATYLMSGAQNGEEINFTLTEDTEIYNCCIGGSNDFIGEATELQMMDRIMVYTDMDGNPLLIYVMYRMVDSPIYYNIERKYSDAKQETTRVPDANGFYVFQMAVGGKQVTLKTRDKAIASKVDSFAYKMMGLEVNGNIIERVYTPYVVCGSDAISPGTERFVVSQTNSILSFAAQGSSHETTTNKVMMPTTEVVDVSGYPGTKIGEKTTIREGDKIRVLQDIYGNLTHVYITERYTGYPIYYNYTRYYSATTGTTRTPDAEGYYVYEMASQGKQVTVKTKDKKLADYIDQQTPNIVALKVNKSGIVTDAAPAQSSVKFGRRVAANGLYMNTEAGNMNFTLASTGKTYTTPISSSAAVYNCGQVYDKFRGEKSKLIKDDQMVAIRDDSQQQVVQVYVIQRKVDCELYYNAKAMYNSVTKETTRVPNEEGYYVYDLAVAGQVKQFKTKDKDIANYIDSRGSTPFAMTVKGDQIKQAFPVTAKKGLKSFAVSNYDFMDAGNGKCVLTCNLSSNANYGKTLEAKLAPDYKAYDVSAYAENFGAQVKLKVGDRVICYYNDDGEIEWFFIWYRNVREEGAWSVCSHCNKRVYWMPYTATTYTADAHMYLTHDQSNIQSVIGKANNALEDQPNVVLDLNGHTLKTAASADRLFVVYGELSVMDTVGGGKIVARSRDTATACGAVMVQQPGTFKLYSGTLCGSGADTKITNGGIVFVGAGSTFKMYGGTVTGGKAKNGGNIHCGYGTFEMYGGTVIGGIAEVGGNVYLGSGTFLMGAGTIDGDVVTTDNTAKVTIVGKSEIGKGNVTGLQLVKGLMLPLSSKVTADTKVAIEADGVFTGKVTDPSAYLQSFTPYDSTFPVFVQDGALACGRLAMCEDCGKEVYWSRFSPAACSGEAHLVLTEDTVITNGFISKTANVAVDLNGHTVSTSGDRTFSVEGGKLSIQDSVGGGKVIGRSNSKDAAAGTIMAYSGGVLNLYSGEICGSDAETKIGNGGVLFIGTSSYFNMYGGTVTGTKATQGGAIYGSKGGVVTIFDGTVTGGTATNGGNIYSEGTVILHKGTVTGGEAKKGGNVYTASALRLNGGTVTGGTAANGGNIYATLGTVNLQGGTVENGVAAPVVADGKITDGNGGNIYAGSAAIIVGATEGNVKATVTGGKAYHGGNIYSDKLEGKENRAVTVNANGTVTLGEAVAVEGDTAASKNTGGNIYTKNTLAVYGAVTDGKADDGGNIFAKNWSDIHGTISGGEAVRRGGNIFVDSSTVQLIGGSKVVGGTADKGGNILSTGNVKVLANAEVSGGNAVTQGGNIFMAAGNKTLTIEGKVLDGTAPAAGNISTVNNLAVVVSGTVTGGSFKLGNGTFTVSGAANIDSLVLAKGQKLTLGALTEGASITLEAEDVFTETSDKAGDYAGYFHYAKEPSEIGVFVKDNALAMGISRYCEACKQDVMWEEFSAAACTGSKHLLLAGDVTLTSQLTIAAADEITIDLNGHTVTVNAPTAGGRFALVYGKLNIQDSSEQGSGKIVSETKLARNGGTVALAATGEMNLYSGTLTLGETAQAGSNGGVVSVGDGTFNMYGGTVTGGKLGFEKDGQTCLGGNVYVRAGKFNLYGGTVTGFANNDKVTLVGGNVYVATGTFAMEGGSINGDVVIGNASAKVSVGGKSTISMGTVTGLKLVEGMKLPLDKVTAETKVVVDAVGIFTEKVADATEYLQNFESANEEYPVIDNGDTLVCGIIARCEKCDADVSWIPFAPENFTGNAHLILMDDVEVATTLWVAPNTSITVDLNGHTLSTAIDRTFSVEGGELNIQDSVGGGKVVGRTNNKEAAAGTVMLYSKGKLNLYSGELTASGADTKVTNGGVVFVGVNCTFNMYGGTVSNGKAVKGGNIYGGAGCAINVAGGTVTGGSVELDGGTFTVSGAPKIDGLVLAAGQKLTLGELTQGASITLDAERTFTNVNEKAADYAGYFHYAKESAEIGVHVLNNALYMGTTRYCAHCDTEVIFDSFAADKVAGSAHLELTEDVTLEQLVIAQDADVVIDLNGKTLKTAALVNGKLSVIDGVGGGTVTGAATDAVNGGVVTVSAGATFNLYSGTVTGGTASEKGGNIYCAEGTFNMHGGTVTGGAAAEGGNLYIGTGTFTMEGGSITGDVVAAATAKLSIGGKSTISMGNVTGLKLAEGFKLALSKFTADTKIVVEVTGIFTEKVTDATDYLQNFEAADPAFPVFDNGDTLACGRLAKCVKCDEEVYWIPFAAASCKDGAHLILTEDVQIGTAYVAANASVTVDLNGHTLSTNADRTFNVEGGELNIQDSAGGGKIVGRTGDKDAAGGAIMLYSKGKLNLYSGTITAGTETKVANGGVVFVGANCTFNMYGGIVTGGKAVTGGNITGGAGSVITIHGGTVTGGQATNGGNIYSEGTVILNKATITGGVADMGGNIYSKSAVRLNDGALVTGGQAANGGNIYIVTGALNMVGGTVENGVATPVVDGTAVTEGKGGNIYAENAAVTVGAPTGSVKATVTGGKAYQGGNIYSEKPEDMKDRVLGVNVNGIVTKGEAVAVEGVTKNLGGNIYSKNTTTIIGTVSDGKAADGGNIYAMNAAKITGTVSGGEATARGGNIFATAELELGTNGAAAKVVDGKAAKGGNILSAASVTVLENAEVSGGAATERGGNIFLASGKTALNVAGKVLNGTAPAAGNISTVNNVEVAVNGGTVTGGSYALGNGTFTVSGDAKIDGLVLASGQKLTMGELTENANIILEADGVFTEVNEKAAEYAGYFHYVEESELIGVHVVDNALVMGIRRYCNDCGAEVMWEAFSTEAFTGNAHLILTERTEVPQQMTVAAGDNITVDLNNFTVTVASGTAGARFALVNGKLNIQDSSAQSKGQLVATVSSARNGGVIALSATGQLNLYSGTLTMAYDAQAGSNGGVVSVGDGIFNMHGGAVTGGKLGYTKDGQECLGANVYVRGGKFNMYGGVIDGSTVNTDKVTILGGSVYGGSGSVITINGGQILNGTAAKGGNIYSLGTVILNGGEIAGGKATLGGNIYSLSAVRNNAGKVSGGQAANGGNIYMELGTANLVGGTVENGVATPVVDGTAVTEGKGGNIYAEKARVFVGADSGDVISTVSGGQAYLGGNIYSKSVDASVAGQAVMIKATGVVTGGQATNGGSIYIESDTLTVSGKVEGGVATPVVNGTKVTEGKGGNIYAHQAVVTVGAASGNVTATVTDGKAYRGGNIYSAKPDSKVNKTLTVNAKGVVTLGEAVAVENDGSTGSKNIGGNIYCQNNLSVYGTVSDGKADDGGNIYAASWFGVYGGSKISGGKAVRRGGNIFSMGTLAIYGGTVENGEAVNGGNIAATANVELSAAGTVQNGTATTGKGGNIYMIITGDGRKTLTVKGKVLGGTAPAGAGIAATGKTDITIDGGEVTGALQPNDSGATLTLSGPPKISNLILPANGKITLGTLTSGADITVSASGAFTVANDKAAEYMTYFKPADKITVTDNVLYMN